MTLIPSDTDFPFLLRRIQFPVRLVHAMTINKSQRQTFDKVGIYLNRACFAHGQLYVAFSRARSKNDIFMRIVETPEQGKHRGHHYTKKHRSSSSSSFLTIHIRIFSFISYFIYI